DVDLLLVLVDALHDPRRDHALLPEDPKPGVDHEATRRLFGSGLVDLSDVSVRCFDVESRHVGQVSGAAGRSEDVDAIRIDLHCTLLSLAGWRGAYPLRAIGHARRREFTPRALPNV